MKVPLSPPSLSPFSSLTPFFLTSQVKSQLGGRGKKECKKGMMSFFGSEVKGITSPVSLSSAEGPSERASETEEAPTAKMSVGSMRAPRTNPGEEKPGPQFNRLKIEFTSMQCR